MRFGLHQDDRGAKCEASQVIPPQKFRPRKNRSAHFGCEKKGRTVSRNSLLFHALKCTHNRHPPGCFLSYSSLEPVGWLQSRHLFIDINFHLLLVALKTYMLFHQLGHTSLSQFRILICENVAVRKRWADGLGPVLFRDI